MAVRSRQVRGNEFSFQLPATQANLADACGISAVHVNRVLMALRRSNVLLVEKSGVHVLDWLGLQAAGHFEGGYLHSKEQTRLAALPPH